MLGSNIGALTIGAYRSYPFNGHFSAATLTDFVVILDGRVGNEFGAETFLALEHLAFHRTADHLIEGTATIVTNAF